MARRTIILHETFGEKQLRSRRESIQRMRALLVIVVLSVVARLIISDPVKPPPEDHAGVPIKIMPGMLASLPLSERAKLDPMLIAKMMAADEDARLASLKAQKPQTELAYKAANTPEQNDPLGENEKRRRHNLAIRQHASDLAHAKIQEEIAAPKKTLVRFVNGGSIRVEDTQRGREGLTLRMAGVAATYPEKMIASVSTNPSEWTEAVPTGMVQLKPAPGITITVAKDSARRITVKKSTYDEI